MKFGHRADGRPRPRPAIAAALGLLAAVSLALPVAADDDARLSNPDLSPRSGTTATVFTLSVTYRSPTGDGPIWVSAVVGEASLPMVGGDGDWATGVRYTWTGALPRGTHAVMFRALSADRRPDGVAAGRVAVSDAAGTPPPATAAPPTVPPAAAPPTSATPAPTPSEPAAPRPTSATTAPPTPRPSTPAPSAAGAPAATARVPTPTALAPTATAPTPGATAPPPAAPAAQPGPGIAAVEELPPLRRLPGSPAAPGQGPPPSGGPRPDPSAQPSTAPVAPTEAPPAGAGTTPPVPQASGPTPPGAGAGRSFSAPWRGSLGVGGWGDVARVLEALGVEPPFASELRLVPALVSSAGGVSMLMAFGFLGRRRRDGLPSAPDAVLEASAARGIEAPAGADLVPAHGDAPMADQESLMPRWRRPSLLDARRSDPSRSVEPLVLMSFASGSVAPVEGLERRYIRYTVVELLDAPDELRAGSVGNLRQGDEVQLLGRSGLYWQVLCPDGRQGWIHRTTLGDVVGDLPAPTAEETWATDSLVDRDVDGEILAAFLASRVRG